MSDKPVLIGVSGQIGAGKSTLVRELGSELGVRPLLERDRSNPYLERFYHDPERWAFHSFLFFFEQSLSDQLDARAHGPGVLQERLPQEHLEVFGRAFRANGFLSGDDMALLERVWALTSRLLRPPDLLIHLEVDPQEALVRVQDRASVGDDHLTRQYLKKLGRRYDRFVDEWRSSPVIRIDTQAVDVRSSDEIERIARDVVAILPSAKVRSVGR